MRVDHEAAHDDVADERLLGPDSRGVEQPCAHTALREGVSAGGERAHLRLVQGDVDGPVAVVRNRRAAFGRDARDEIVVEIETAHRQVVKRSVRTGFDVRRQHAGRRLRRAHADRPLVDDSRPTRRVAQAHGRRRSR
jgi:hypothetical protein